MLISCDFADADAFQIDINEQSQRMRVRCREYSGMHHVDKTENNC